MVMKKRFSFRTLILTLITALLYSAMPFFASATPSWSDDKPFISPDLARTEAENMNRFAALVRGFYDQLDTLRKASKPDPRQVAAAENKLRDIKSQLSGFQNDA